MNGLRTALAIFLLKVAALILPEMEEIEECGPECLCNLFGDGIEQTAADALALSSWDNGTGPEKIVPRALEMSGND